MKIVHKGIIITGLVITLAIILLSPAFINNKRNEQLSSEILTEFENHKTRPILLTFEMFNRTENNLQAWCLELSSILEKYNIKSTVFISGIIANDYPSCVSLFSKNNNIDIGSQTYSYISLPSIPDYLVMLEEVRTGKDTVDRAGNITSALFRAPFGKTDQNIYSLLNRSEIIADFSYPEQYNVYENEKGLFMRYDADSIETGKMSKDNNTLHIPFKKEPLIVIMNSTQNITHIQNIISQIASLSNIVFSNPSEITNKTLTQRIGN